MASHAEQLPSGDAAPVGPSQARRRARSIALAVALVLFAVTFYILTLVKMGPALFDRML